MRIAASLTTPLTDTEFQELEDFLETQCNEASAMGLSMLQGFYTAIQLNPQPIAPSQWLPWIWDPEQGEAVAEFADEQEAAHYLDLIMRFYHQTAKAIHTGEYLPVLEIDEDGADGENHEECRDDDQGQRYDPREWCAGFVQGMWMDIDPWLPILENHIDWVDPFLLLGSEEGLEFLASKRLSYFDTQDLLDSVVHSISMQVEQLRDYFSQVHSGTHPKVGHPELCPCGSGKPFKQCCGQRALH